MCQDGGPYSLLCAMMVVLIVFCVERDGGPYCLLYPKKEVLIVLFMPR
jgi:hypothetical protein